MALPLIPIAAGGALLLLLMSKKSEAAAKAPYSTAPTDGSKPVTKEPAAPAKGWAEMPPALQEQVAAALGALGVSPATGEVEGTPTADAIKLATQTAALCESQGFYDVAKELNRLIGIAAKRVPTPPEAAVIKQTAPPGLTPEQVEAIARTLTLDRDPKSIEALIKSLEKLPPSPQRDNYIQMAQALLLQLAAAQSTTQTMQQIDQVITSPGWPQVQQAITPLPPVVVPVVTPPAPGAATKPPVVLSPAPAVPTAPKPPTAAQIQKVLGSRVLQTGMAGSDVLGWQQWLKMDGFPTLATDSQFGTNTTNATKAWQAAHGLTPDGKVGPATKAKIGSPAGQALPAAAAAPAVKPAAAPVATGARILARGMSGPDVKTWQQQLVSDGYKTVATDGAFGPGTETATKSWQQQRGISPDGKVGPATRAKIGSKANVVAPAPASAAAPAPSPAQTAATIPSGPLTLDMFPDPNPSAPLIKQGSPKSDYVKSFQTVLNTFGYPVGTPDGVFGPNTAKQTKAFQAWSLGYYKDKRIVPDGTVGPITRRLVRMRAAELLRNSGQAAA